MIRRSKTILPLIALTLVCLLSPLSCGEKNDPDNGGSPVTKPEEKPSEGQIDIYTTSADRKHDFELTHASFEAPSAAVSTLTLSGDTFQTVDGFGAAITQSSCYNLLKMTQDRRTAFLKEVFDPKEGLGSSMIRVCIGGSDFSMDEFTWCDKEGISNFAVHPLDEQYLFPILKEIFAINPAVKIVASPWSSPRWMKLDTNLKGKFNSWTSGRLNPDCYDDYATYFVKWIQEMESRGFPIYAITMQNEPLNHGNSMSLYMPWQDQRDFLKNALGPSLLKANLPTKVLLYDHNYDQWSYPANILADPEAAMYAAGSAWHNYGGSVNDLDKYLAKYPDYDLYFTEASIGTWNHVNFSDNFIADFKSTTFDVLARGSKGTVLWNLMLDQEHSPYRPGGCGTCWGAVTINNTDYSTIGKNTHYYFIAHASKVIRPGAVRLGVKGNTSQGLSVQAYRNTDGSLGLLILNEGNDVRITFSTDKHSARFDVAGKSIISVKWVD